ncbi:hypothetical protein FACS1894193_04900 [Bacilli bacterium]|nr:hypothetical protein FACS1894192_07530 [Bacilli bacterium]GHU41296.1 hypothetical protein FACS1894193_04900 [Bacilli bacterium]
MTTYEEMVALGLHGDAPLKLILKGFVEDKQGVVAVVFATLDENKAEAEMKRLLDQEESDVYYMVYSVPFDTDLTTIDHYPSIAISGEDLK